VIGSPYPLDDDDGGPVNQSHCIEIARFFREEINRIIALSNLQEYERPNHK
jgi:hypothetical protein